MAAWKLSPTRETLHGHFSSELPPVLTVDPGDTVTFETLDANWNVAPKTIPESRPFEPRDPVKDEGHCLSGPIDIRGAEPGMTLEVKIHEVLPARLGWTVAGGWPHDVNKRLGIADGDTVEHIWRLDPDAMVGRNQLGFQVALRPFMGVMGLAPAEPGIHSTIPPRRVGGNLDCKELVAGTSLFLPVEVVGGRFSLGDGHASQGDGEVSVTAIECAMERVVVSFELHKEMRIDTPRAKTASAWLTLGLHEDLDEACYRALEAMVDLIGDVYGVDRRNALALASVTVDMRITQIVNQVLGVHAVLPFSALTKTL